MAKRKISPQLKAYSSCVKDLGLNPRMMQKGAKDAAKNKAALKSCAIKKLEKMGIKPKK